MKFLILSLVLLALPASATDEFCIPDVDVARIYMAYIDLIKTHDALVDIVEQQARVIEELKASKNCS